MVYSINTIHISLYTRSYETTNIPIVPKLHCLKGSTEIKNLDNIKKYTEMKSYMDADVLRDVSTRRSI